MAQLAIEIGEQREDIDLEFGHFADIAHIADKAVERAEQIAEGVAQFAVLVARALEDFVTDAVVLGRIDAERPQPDDVRAVLFHDLERIDRIAEALGHLAPVAGHGEAMCQHLVIGRAAARGAAFEQRGLEPPAMLVAALQIKVGGPFQCRPAPAFEREGMRAARIEPDIEDVGDHFVIVGIVRLAEEFGLTTFVPGIDALLAHCGDDARVDFGVLQIFARAVLHEQRYRHAPGALARQHPVGAPLDHRADPAAALFGDEADALDFGHGAAAQRAAAVEFLVHRHEPLRGAAIDHLGFRPPAMRVGMLVIVTRRQQRARFAQIAADRAFGRIERLVDHAAAAFLAVLVQIASAEPFPVVAIAPVGHDREDRLEPVGAAQQEIVFAMVGRHVDEPGA